MKRLLAFALLVPLLLCGGPAFAVPSPARHRVTLAGRAAPGHRTAAARPTVDLVLKSVAPHYLASPTQTLRMNGELQNRSDAAYPQLWVRLRYGPRAVTSRGELDAYASGRGADPIQATRPQAVTGGLVGGGRQTWSLAIPVKQLGLRGWGVYLVAVELIGPGGAILGHQRTFIASYPKGTAAQKTRISWIWPVVDQPHRADDTTFVDDQLDRQFDSGRLAHVVDAATRTRTPVTWLVDPALVDDALAMAAKDGYTIKGGAHRGSNVAAGRWLTQLSGATSQKRLLATPYADPDVVSLSRAGLSKDIKTATDAARRPLTAARLTGVDTSVVVPPAGQADQRTLSGLVAAGARTIVLSSAALPDYQAQTYTPNPLAKTVVGGVPVKLIAYDETLSRVLGMDTTDPGGAVLAEQRFLAETAMITAEAPNKGRTVVVAPPRRWDPDPTFARRLLTDLSAVPWLRPIELRDVEALTPVGRVLAQQKTTAGLPRTYLRQVRIVSDRIRRFSSIFQPPQSGFALGVARAESSAWSDATHPGAALRDTLSAELAAASAKVKVLNSQISLAGTSARLPITVSNELAHGTVRVRVRAYSQNTARLRVAIEDRTLVLAAGHKDQVRLYMKASANGPAYVNLELLTPDGRPFGVTRVLQVQATGYGPTALLITGGSLAVLFLGVGMRVIRRRRQEAEETSV